MKFFTDQQIKDELRNAATQALPLRAVRNFAYDACNAFRTPDDTCFSGYCESPFDLEDADLRTFFLLVAEAL